MAELRYLPTFRAIYETRHLTRAAKRLHLSQPAVTYQLKRFEAALGGAPLFVRHHTGMEPTVRAERLYAITQELDERLAHLDDELPRRLTIASVSVFGRYLVAPLLRAARVEHVLRLPTADEVITRVVSGDSELGFVFQSVRHPALACEPVFDEHYVMVAPKRRRLPVPGEPIALVTYDEGDYVLGRWVGHHYRRATPRWSTACHYEEVEEVLDAVASGLGCAVVPRSCVASRRGRVHVVGARAPVINTVYAIRQASRPLGPAAEALLAALAKRA